MPFNKQQSQTKSSAKEQVNHNFFFVEVPFNIVGPEAMAWGEGSWWPKNSLTQFSRISDGELNVGTRFKMKIMKPVPAALTVEVTKFVPNKILELTFKSGIFKGGYEVIKLEERTNGTRLDYEFHSRAKGVLNQVLSLLYQNPYAENAKLILSSLKEHVLKEYHDHQERQLEGA